MKRAIGNLVPSLCGKIQVAVMTFGSSLKNEFCFNCYENDIDGRLELINAINNIPYRDGYTHTGEAARCAYHEYLTSSCGLLDETNCIDVIFITDGKANHGPLSATVCDEAKCLRNHHTHHHILHVYAIGIGTSVNEAEINCIAGNDEDSIFSLKDFDEFDLRINQTLAELLKMNLSCVDNFRSQKFGDKAL